MVFSSTVFLFGFLLFVFAGYFGLMLICGILNRMDIFYSSRNYILTAASLFFYAWGEPWVVLIMLLCIAMNWYAALLIDRYRTDAKRARQIVAVGVFLNLSLLFVYKYLAFAINNVNLIFNPNMPLVEIARPIGISFFTFQAMSYTIDVYRGDGAAQRKFSNICLFISLFPQLIAGPIVRYKTIAEEVMGRRENLNDVAEGVRRFVTGFLKKILLANNLGLLSKAMFFETPLGELTAVNAWLGDIAYALQIYYDFAGYSEMAIGLGLILGFHFLENFNFPYIAKSVTEFWRRWHMSLGTWFRDYLYFPLGGSRVKTPRWILNMFIVWGLTGLWHGAEWTFLVWGLCFFAILVFERLIRLEKRWVKYQWLRYVYALLLNLITSVIIYSRTLPDAFGYLSCMFGMGNAGLYDASALLNLREYAYFLAPGILFAMPCAAWLKIKLKVNEFWSRLASNALLFAGFVIAVSFMVQGSYNPFIYFNF
jgi:alginate O-acetyltransferase complex protein AlgI